MSYVDEKRRKEESRRKRGYIFFAIFVFFVAALSVFSIFYPAESWKYYFALPKVERREEGELRIHFLDVGNADATLVELPDGQTLLIDGGDVDGAEKILRYLNALKIQKLDYILVTHTDTDHCGSLAEVAKYKKVGSVIFPYAQSNASDNAAFNSFAKVIAESTVEVKNAERYVGFASKSEEYPYQFTILFPYSAESGGNGEFEKNALSTVALLEYAGVTALFCGDTNSEVLEKLCTEDGLGVFAERGIDLQSVEILKYPHHGAKDGANEEIIDYLNVKTAVISCGRNNYYGHPNPDTLTALLNCGVETYRTDWHGAVAVTVSSNGDYAVEYGKKE